MGETDQNTTVETGAVNERPEDLRAMRGGTETAEDEEDEEEPEE